MHVVHPIVDEWTDTYAVFVASSRHVLLTEPLAGFLDFTKSEGLKPILVTGPEARISPFVSFAMLHAGGHWVLQTEDGVFDGMSGFRIGSFAELWSSVPGPRDRWHTYTAWSPEPEGALLFDLFAHQRAAIDTQVGHVGAAMVTALGGGALDIWGTTEPLTETWDVEAVTETARRGMPVSDVMHARAADDSFCDISVERTKRGILEHVKGGVPVGPYPSEPDELMARATTALTMAAERFQPTVGFVSFTESDGQWQEARANRPELPLAVVLGPRAVHDLKLDADELGKWYDLTVLGRRRTPCVLVRFTQPDTGLWRQLTMFAYDLGIERIYAAAGFTEN
ncbi:DUF6177 family protein [Georgenia alba]|uniref:DUF6177 family protein n=1 Tax=Georgenia alba TaxID=2233858 RepID=A0ABW2Q6C8_9MICO